MSTPCTASAASMTSVLLAGDVILNLSPESLNTPRDAAYVNVHDGALQVSPQPGHVPAKACSADALTHLDCSRLVVVSEADNADAEAVVRSLEERGMPVLHCCLAADCDADAFMDEEDSEAVAERLRQLGYL